MMQTKMKLKPRDFLDVLVIVLLLVLFLLGLWQLSGTAETTESVVIDELAKYAVVTGQGEDTKKSGAAPWSWLANSGLSDVWYKPEPHAPWQPLKKAVILTPGAQLKTGAEAVIRLQITDRVKKQQRLVEVPRNSFFVLTEGEGEEQAIPLENYEQVKKKEQEILVAIREKTVESPVQRIQADPALPDDQEQELWWLKSPQGRVVSDENLARRVPLAWAYLREEPFLLKVERVGHPNETRTKKLNKGFVEWSFESSGRYVITVEGVKSKKQLQSQFELAILKTPVWRMVSSSPTPTSSLQPTVSRDSGPVPQLSLVDSSAPRSVAESLEIRVLDEKGNEWSKKSARWLGQDFAQIWQDLLPQMGERFGGRVVSLQTRQWSSEAQSPWSAPVLMRVPPIWKSKLGQLRWNDTSKELVWNEESRTCSTPLVLPKAWEGPEQVYAFLRIYNEQVDVRYDVQAVDTKKGICPILPPGNYRWDYELAMRPFVGSEEWETVTLLKGKSLAVRWQDMSRETLLARLGLPAGWSLETQKDAGRVPAESTGGLLPGPNLLGKPVESNHNGEAISSSTELPPAQPWEQNALALRQAQTLVGSDGIPTVSSGSGGAVALDPKQYGVRWLPPRTTLYSSRADGWMWYELNWVADDEALVAFEVRWGEDPRLPEASSYRQWIQGRTYLLMLPKQRVWYARVLGFNRQGQAIAQSPLREIRSVVLKNTQYSALSAIATDPGPEKH